MWWTTSIPGLLALIELEKAEEAKRAKAVWLNAFDVNQALLQLPINNAMDERMDSVDGNTGEANAD